MTNSVFIVDDHKIVRDGLKAILMGYPQYEFAGEAATAEEAKRKLSQNQIDFVFVDLRLPDMNGALLIADLLAFNQDLKCILLTAEPNTLDLQRAKQAGAMGFLTKEIDGEEYIKALDTIINGKKYVSQTFSHLLVDNNHELSFRELEVLQAIADGLPYKQVADRLNISARTVEAHKNNILSKLEVATPIEMVRKAVKLGLIKG